RLMVAPFTAAPERGVLFGRWSRERGCRFIAGLAACGSDLLVKQPSLLLPSLLLPSLLLPSLLQPRIIARRVEGPRRPCLVFPLSAKRGSGAPGGALHQVHASGAWGVSGETRAPWRSARRFRTSGP